MLRNAEELIFGSFPTASAVARYIRQKNPGIVCIVAMDGKESEDDVFAEYLKNLLLGKRPNKEYVKQYLQNHKVSARFLNANIEEFPMEDINYCLDIDHFNFICLVKRQGKNIKIIRYPV